MDTINLLQNHRSIRKYKSTPIPSEVLERILECGCRASNTGNMQLYSIVVTQDPNLKQQLSQLHFGQGSSAPVFLTLCVDINRYHHWCRLRGCDEPYGNLLWLMSGTVDASLCAQNICIAAEAEGLGFCYLGTVLYNTAAIAELLELPHGVMPVITLSMGYPDAKTQSDIMRERHHENPLDRVQSVTDAEGLVRLIDEVQQTYMADEIYDYISALVEKTRTNPFVVLGVSPRTVEAWESGKSTPSPTAKKLMYLISLDHSLVQKLQ